MNYFFLICILFIGLYFIVEIARHIKNTRISPAKDLGSKLAPPPDNAVTKGYVDSMSMVSMGSEALERMIKQNQSNFGQFIPPYIPDFPKYGTFSEPITSMKLQDPKIENSLDNTQPQLWIATADNDTADQLYLIYPNGLVEVFIAGSWTESYCSAEEARVIGTFISYV
jgi:hypothetical protein